MPALVKTIPFHKDKIPKTKLATQKIAKISAVIKKGDDGGLDVGFYTNVIKGINKIQLETPIGGEDTDTEDEKVVDYKALLLESGVKIESVKKLKGWFISTDDILVGKQLRFLFKENSQISIDAFMQGIDYTGSIKQFESSIMGGSKGGCYGKLWIKSKGFIEINPVVRQYLNTLKK